MYAIVLGRDDDIERVGANARIEDLHGESASATPFVQQACGQCGAAPTADGDGRPWRSQRGTVAGAYCAMRADRQPWCEGSPGLAQIDPQHAR